MLRLPETGVQLSVKKHNVEIEVVADWIEGSTIFSDGKLSQTDAVDILTENNVYRDQSFALEMLGTVWLELARRARALGDSAPFAINGRRIQRTAGWREAPGYSFCLLLSLQTWYRTWAETFGDDYTEQGALFERLTEECLCHLGWETRRTGWAPGQPARIRDVVSEVADHIGEPEIGGMIDEWLSDNANDEGLDIVCSSPFRDRQGGRPLYFFQCASGANWQSKVYTPNPEVWRKIISFTTIPQRGFALPFSLTTRDFKRWAGLVNGMMLDRCRLIPTADGDHLSWISPDLARDLVRWMRPRVRTIPLSTR